MITRKQIYGMLGVSLLVLVYILIDFVASDYKLGTNYKFYLVMVVIALSYIILLIVRRIPKVKETGQTRIRLTSMLLVCFGSFSLYRGCSKDLRCFGG